MVVGHRFLARRWLALGVGGSGAVFAAGRAGFADHDFREAGESRCEALPDPAREILTGRVLEAFDLVQIVVIQSFPNRFAGIPNVGEINDPTELRIELSLYANTDPVRVPVQTLALVPIRNVRKQVRRLETELSPDLHIGPDSEHFL